MRQSLRNRIHLPSSCSNNARLSSSAIDTISSILTHSPEIECSESCKVLPSSSIPCLRHSTQQQRRWFSSTPRQYSAHNASNHSMSTLSPSFGEYDRSDNEETMCESLTRHVGNAMQNHDRDGMQFQRQFYPVQLNGTKVGNPSASSPPTTVLYDMIDAELQHMRVGKKNIKGLILKLTQNYPLGSAPAQYTDMCIDAIDYCLRSKKSSRANEVGLQNAIKLIFWLISERTAGNPNATFDTERTLNPLLDAGRIRSRPQDFCAVAVELLSSLSHLAAENYQPDELSSSPALLPPTMMPNLKTYNLVLSSISKSRRRDAPVLIQSIISSMSATSEASLSTVDTVNIPDIAPDTISYNTLLYSHSQQPPSFSDPRIQSNHNNTTPFDFPSPAHECEAILRTLPPTLTDTISYNIVLHAWSRASQSDAYAAPRAEALLREMQERSNKSDPSFVLRPNYISFTTVIAAWGNSRDLDAAERSEDIYRLMESLAIEGGMMDDLRPNVRTLNAVLDAYAKSAMPGAARRAEELLMEAVRRCTVGGGSNDLESGNTGKVYPRGAVVPGTISFSICIKAWANSDERGAFKHALNLLKLMQELNRTPTVFSNMNPLTTSLPQASFQTWPDVGTVNSSLRSLTNDNEFLASKAQTAESVLEWMVDVSGLQPDLQTYNIILRCCCTTKPTVDDQKEVKQHAVKLATRILAELRRTSGQRGGVRPDPYTFNFFMKVCDRLCDNNVEKVRLIEEAFYFCIDMGQFSNPVLSILKNTLGRDKVKELLKMDNSDCRSVIDLRVDDFPSEWSCGMKQGSSGDKNVIQNNSGSVPSTLRRIARRHN